LATQHSEKKLTKSTKVVEKLKKKLKIIKKLRIKRKKVEQKKINMFDDDDVGDVVNGRTPPGHPRTALLLF
jgi:hypothetical protein